MIDNLKARKAQIEAEQGRLSTALVAAEKALKGVEAERGSILAALNRLELQLAATVGALEVLEAQAPENAEKQDRSD